MQLPPKFSSPPISDQEEVEAREQEAPRDNDDPLVVYYIGVSLPVVVFAIVDSVLLYVFHIF